jgi:hypothetical protein
MDIGSPNQSSQRSQSSQSPNARRFNIPTTSEVEVAPSGAAQRLSIRGSNPGAISETSTAQSLETETITLQDALTSFRTQLSDDQSTNAHLLHVLDKQLPKANLATQPTLRQDSIKGGQCYIYSTIAAVETIAAINGIEMNETDFDTALNECSRECGPRMGGNPYKPLKAMGYNSIIATQTQDFLKTLEKGIDENGSPKNPLMLGVTLSAHKIESEESGRDSNHWVYVVGADEDNIYIRDQQNRHVTGFINKTTLEGQSATISMVKRDGNGNPERYEKYYKYKMTQVAVGIPRQQQQ